MFNFNLGMRFLLAGVGLSCALTATESFGADEKDPTRNIKPMENNQKKIRDGVKSTTDTIKELLGDIDQNIGLELDSKGNLKDGSEKLDGACETLLPEILEQLGRARNDQTRTRENLRGALNGQDEFVKLLESIAKNMKKDLAPVIGKEALSRAIELQQKALEKARETRQKEPNLEGKPQDKLTEGEKKALTEAKEKQKDAAEEIEKALKDLKQLAEQPDKDAAKGAREAIETLKKAEAPRNAHEAKDDVGENKLRTAERKQEEVLKALTEANTELGAKNDKIGQLEKKLGDLNAAKGMQERAKEETENLDPKDDKGLAEAAKHQGEVSKALEGMGDKNLENAANESGKAQDDIAQDKPKDATKSQERVLGALNDAIKNTEKELADMQNQPQPQTPKQQQDSKVKGKVAVNNMQYGKLNGQDESEGWVVALPPKERAEVEQASKVKMPRKYEGSVNLYYKNLAGAKAEN
jgi:hypothetical protein